VKAETLAQTLAKLLRAGFRPVFLDNPPLDATLYGAGWDTIVYEKNGRLWQLMLRPERRIAVVARLS
jgi:hypothetical protein